MPNKPSTAAPAATPLAAPLVVPPEAAEALRARAEQRRRLVTQAPEHCSPQEMQRLVQELQVHQIELEMQYEELQLAQVAAEKARLAYVDLYDFAPVGYVTLNAAGLIEQLNLAGSRQLGTVRQRLVGRRFALFVHPAGRAEFGQFLARVLATDATVRCELVLQREDGSPFFAQLEGLRGGGPTPEHGESPLECEAAHCRIVLMDITARRVAADALAASEARFRKLFAQSYDAVVLLQGDMYVDCNAAALRLLGATRREQVVGHTAWALAPEYQPDGRRTMDLFRESMAEALHQGTKRCEALMRTAAGQEIWMEAVLTPIEEEGGGPLVHVLWRDIKAERLAAIQLRESEARLSLALEASETGVFARDFVTSLVTMDERAQVAFGWAYTPDVLPLQQVYNSIHPDDAARVRAIINEGITSLTPLAVDFRVRWPDGSEHHLSMAGRVVTDAQGQPSSFIGVLRDVTAVRAAKEELHYKSLVLERLLNNMPLMLARLRPDGTYLESVGMGLRALGLKDNALVGRSAHQVFPALSAYLGLVLQGAQARFLSELEVESQPVAFQNFGFFDEQRQQAVILSVDVTEAEQQKQQLRREKEFTQSLLENSVDGIVALDQTGRITAWNSQATRYFGHRAAAVLGRSLFAVLPQLDTDAARQVLARVLGGESVLLPVQSFPHRTGHFDVYYIPLRHANDEAVTGILIMFRDVTERDHLSEEATRLRLRQQQEVLAAILDTQETERKRIAEALHNGLGQLLYATKLSLEGRASEGTITSPVRESLRLLEEAIRATRTISFELTPGILEDFGLRIALEELAKRLAPACLPVRLHLIGLERRLRPALEITVYRVVQELLNNVMKHAAATEVMVHIAREHGRVEVSVEDNGQGFEAARLATQPLAGIGLAGVRNRVALLGGTLAIHSRLGRGTIISFELNE